MSHAPEGRYPRRAATDDLFRALNGSASPEILRKGKWCFLSDHFPESWSLQSGVHPEGGHSRPQLALSAHPVLDARVCQLRPENLLQEER